MMLYFIKKHRQKEWLIGVPLIIAVLFFNPIFAKIMSTSIFPGYKEYSRMSWMLLAPILFGVVLAELMSNKHYSKRVLVSVISFLVLINMTGSFAKLIIEPQNSLKLYDYVLDICQALDDDIDSNVLDGIDDVDRKELESNDMRPNVLVQSETQVDYGGDLIYYGLRQYTSKVKLNQVVILSEAYNAENFDLANYNLMNYQYFVCVNTPALRNQAEKYGFSNLIETEEYVLYKNEREFTAYFVRHGQTYANVDGIFAGSATDTVLTDAGKEQADNTGMALSGVEFSAVYTSELTRTKQTAELVMSHNKNVNYSIRVNSCLNDIYWGNIEGLTIDEVFSEYSDFSEDEYIGEMDDMNFVSPIGAETKYSVVNKLSFVLNNVIAANADNGSNVLVVGHSSMQWWLQSITDDSIGALDNAGITVLKYDCGKWSIQCVNVQAQDFDEVECE